MLSKLLWKFAKKHWGNLMLTLDQVKLLEDKVESLITTLKSLYGERDALRDVLQKKDKEIAELSSKVATYEAEQTKIEERVVSALNQLDVFQNSVNSAKAILSQANVASSQQASQDELPKEEASSDFSASPSTQEASSTHKEQEADATLPQKEENQATQEQPASHDAEAVEQDESSEEDADKQMDIF